jgi:hypothetical protein
MVLLKLVSSLARALPGYQPERDTGISAWPRSFLFGFEGGHIGRVLVEAFVQLNSLFFHI